MKLMKGDKVLAVSVTDPGKQAMLRPVPDVDIADLPWELFYCGSTNDIPISRLIEWAEGRVVPENRIGIEDLLKKLGMEHYNAWEIACKTGARMSSHDDYWIKFK